jgi:hypothetical protein
MNHIFSTPFPERIFVVKSIVQRVHSALRVVVTAFAVVCLLSLATITFSSPAHAATNTSSASGVSYQQGAVPMYSTIHGCPPGYGCIYPENAGWNNDHPSLMYYYYGTYQLSYQEGYHYVFNNQTGGAKFWYCTDWNGNTCPSYQPAGTWWNVNLSPINSVKLTP